MDERPAKRPRRDDRDHNRDRDYTASPRSPRPQDSRPHNDERNGYSRDTGRDDDRKRRRSRSPPRDKPSGRRERSRDRDRDRSYRDRDRDRDRNRDRHRDERRGRRDRDHRPRNHSRSRSRSGPRSRSPPRNGTTLKRTRSPPPPRGARTDHDRDRPLPPTGKPETTAGVGVNGAKPEPSTDLGPDDEGAYLSRMMGFNGFKSTKNTKVPGNQWYAVRKEKKTEYRQYMNRVGGFNRPLSPSR